MHTDEDVRKLVELTERVIEARGYSSPSDEAVLSPFREQRPRVCLVNDYAWHPDGRCKELAPCKAIELTDAVKDALDKAGVDYD